MAYLADLDLAQLQLYADNQERVLICCHGECGYALSVAASQATSHLRDKHNTPRALRDGLTRYLKHQHAFPFRNPTTNMLTCSLPEYTKSVRAPIQSHIRTRQGSARLRVKVLPEYG